MVTSAMFLPAAISNKTGFLSAILQYLVGKSVEYAINPKPQPAFRT